MQSLTTRQFWRLFSDLPPGVQRDAQRADRLFRNNPMHLDYRALGVLNKDRVVWYWIGSQAGYDRLI